MSRSFLSTLFFWCFVLFCLFNIFLLRLKRKNVILTHLKDIFYPISNHRWCKNCQINIFVCFCFVFSFSSYAATRDVILHRDIRTRFHSQCCCIRLSVGVQHRLTPTAEHSVAQCSALSAILQISGTKKVLGETFQTAPKV